MLMSPLSRLVAAAGCLVALAVAANAQQADWLKGSTEQQLKALAEIQPGLGTVMIEYSYRFGTMYYAARGGNWGLASYQLKEMQEIQEVAETTRPARKAGLTAFEEGFLGPLNKAIEAKDIKKFNVAFQASLAGCNGCHAAQGFPFIKYELPKSSPSPLSSKP
jgi:hypothetical protein